MPSFLLTSRSVNALVSSAALAAALLVTAVPSSAQSLPSWAEPSAPSAFMSPPDPGGSPGTPGTPAQSVPLDGGLSLLAAAGGALAVRRLRQRAAR